MTSNDSAQSDLPSSDLPSSDLPPNNLALTDGLATAVSPKAPVKGKAVEAFKGAFWGVFFSTFITIFLAELGDKTQVATLLLSAESQSPITVFLGAGLALVSTSLIGVLLGKWMASRVSEDTLDTFAGILLLLITIGLVGDILGV
ncbi:MAG: TMEM165/GDT1 family protein [Phormidesmis sp.]